MRKVILLLLFFSFASPFPSHAKEFLGAPVVPEGKVEKKTQSRLKVRTEMSHREVMAFYKQALKGLKDIKFRDWEDESYIEDDGARPWHSITVSKGKGETTVVIVKDNWTWIVGTLLIRFIAVFVVLTFLFVAMTLSGKLIPLLVERSEKKDS